MNRPRHSLSLPLLNLLFLAVLAGCTTPSGEFGSYAPSRTESEEVVVTDSRSATARAREASEPVLRQAAQAGTLTAGTFNDNRNFQSFLAYRKAVMENQAPGLLPTSTDEHELAMRRFSGQRVSKTTLDIAFVIDTTGSMSDELSYLQTEFMALSNAIEQRFPQAKQRWSLVVYRDHGDEYLAETYDFERNAGVFRDELAKQSANGGGDFPEAPEAAFEEMLQLRWRDDVQTSKLAFWVADAPHHPENARRLLRNFRHAQAADIRIYPIASSGIDEVTELTMRSGAQLTGGRYLFLTDDSGVGNSHKEPTVPCYHVTRLDHAILRVIDAELSGDYREPTQNELIRTVGRPEGETCLVN